MVSIWNILAFLYHWHIIHMDIASAMVSQILAWVTETIVSPFYEKNLISINKIINKGVKERFKTHISWHKVMPKYLTYTALFIGFYGSLYILRLYLFNKHPMHIDVFGINIAIHTSDASFIKSTINMTWFTFLGGWAMGSFILARKAKKISFKKLILWIKSFRNLLKKT